MKTLSRTLAIDPSINFCGTADFKGKQLFHSELLQPDHVGKQGTYLDKCVDIYNQLEAISELYDVLILEIPEHWGAAGYLSRESGAIFKVTFLCGMIFTLPNVTTYTPSEWKGQLPKEVVRNRLAKIYPKVVTKKLNHNIMDAIGIGHRHIYGKI